MKQRLGYEDTEELVKFLSRRYSEERNEFDRLAAKNVNASMLERDRKRDLHIAYGKAQAFAETIHQITGEYLHG